MTEPNWKPSRTERKKAERERKLETRSLEESAKRAVRRRDRGCRFPLCGCKKLGLRLEVAHAFHKGMGGNPTGDRSVPALLVQLCEHRHQHGAISFHKGTLRVVFILDGFNGPVSWWIDANRMLEDYAAHPQAWKEVARESAPGRLEPLTIAQKILLEQLAEMDL